MSTFNPNAIMDIDHRKVGCTSLEGLRALKKKAKKLYKSDTTEDPDKIKLLTVIGDLEEKIRHGQFKEKLLNGEA